MALHVPNPHCQRIQHKGFGPVPTGLTAMVVAVVFVRALGFPTSPDKLSKLEKEEIEFAKSSLMREIGAKASSAGVADENSIRRAHRKIALRYRQHIFSDTEKFEFQMRILNLARESLMRGEPVGGGGDGPSAGAADEGEDGEHSSGRELPAGARMSEDILKQIQSWQEYALEEGVRLDGPEVPFFVGHTLYGFRQDFEANWTHFIKTELVEMWPAAAQLRLHVELQGGESTTSSNRQERARSTGQAVLRLARDALSTVAGLLHVCGAGRDGSLEGVLPKDDDAAAWVDLQLRASKGLRSLLTGGLGARSSAAAPMANEVVTGKGRQSEASVVGGETGSAASSPLPCAAIADRDTRLALLELNLQALVQLDALDGSRRQDIAAEIRVAHETTIAARSEASPLHCREVASQRRAALDSLWEDYQFGPLVNEAYPLDACSLDGLASFIEFHAGIGGELLERKGEPDRTVLRAIRGLHWIQRALARPASLEQGQWRDAVGDLEAAVWQGVAFPELHEAAGKLFAEVAAAGLMPSVLEVALEHPPVFSSPGGSKSSHGREPGDAQPAKSRRFSGLDVPGYSLKPIERYEELAISMWGDEDREDHWDPVRLGLAFIDLVPACEMPIQIAMCFLSAALWFWRALQLLGDKCGGDAWLDIYINEDLFSVSPDSKRLAMQFGLKRAIFELVEYATQFAEHHLQPGARLAVHRTAYVTLWRVASSFGASEDAPRIIAQLRRTLSSARLNPFWAPPVLQVSDAIFADILGGRLHSSFLEGMREKFFFDMGRKAAGDDQTSADLIGPPVPGAVLEHCIYEGAIMGLGDMVSEPTVARFEVMGALLREAGRPSWAAVEDVFAHPPFRLDMSGFAVGRRLTWPSEGRHGKEEFTAVRGVRINMRSGEATLLLARPNGALMPVFSFDDLSEVMSLRDDNPLFLSFDAPTERGGVEQYPHHPFQRVFMGVAGAGRRLESTMLHVSLTLQQLAAGTEVAVKAPFPLRPCQEGLCQYLPRSARSAVQPVKGLPGEPWDVPPRLMIECSSVEYTQRFEGDVLEILLGDPRLEVHPGKPLRDLNEETFKTWPVNKLRRALSEVEDRDSDDLPPLEKHELVERILRALEHGKLLEDEDERSNPLAHFSRRFTHHMAAITDHLPHFARLKPLCALRTIGLMLEGQLQQMNQSASAQYQEVRAGAAAHVQAMRGEQHEYWRNVLADVHVRLLGELGFVDLDPGRCFEGQNDRNFAKCCSVGDYATECWQDELHTRIVEPLGQVGREDRLRCCGTAARRTGVNMQLVASIAAQLGSSSPRRPPPEVLIPAVSEWINDPNGATSDGEAHSTKVIDLLAEKIDQDALLSNTGHELRRPIQRLESDLQALKPGERGQLPAHDSGGQEFWLPVPPVASTGQRRVLYSTISLAPQVQHVDASELSTGAEPGEQIAEVSLDSLHSATIGKVDAPSASGDGELAVLHETALLLSDLDEQADSAKGSAVAAAGDSEPKPEFVPSLSEDADCSFDGWRDLPFNANDRRAAVGAGQRIRTRRRLGENVNGEIGELRAELTLTGAPGESVTVWEVAPLGGGSTQYLDPADSDLVVSVPCRRSVYTSADESNLDGMSVAASQNWPSCIEVDVAFPSADGAGLFLNLRSLNITIGCFLNDCSYSDHFASPSPADCSRTCAKIGACRWWTFQEPAPPTCWLRGEGVRTHEEAIGYSSGSRSCLAPPEEQEAEQRAESSVFDLVLGAVGVPPPVLWNEFDLLGVLEDYGNSTIEELRHARPSVRRTAALRVAAVAKSSCATTWQGCM